jgi:VIT1/CCC1 family predicted Fe2+/Mn2+ transporter
MKSVTHDELINEVMHHIQTDPHKRAPGLSDFILGAQDGLVNVLGVVLGASKVLVTKLNPIRSGLEMLIVGGLAAGVAYVVGALLKGIGG